MTLRVQLLDPAARLPERSHPGDAGYDLYLLEPVLLLPGQRVRARTGIAIELPPGHAGLVLPRSGLAARYGLTLVNTPGLIDEGYRGEVQILLLNTDPEDQVELDPGERIAQLVIVPVAAPEVVEVEELSTTARGEGGFGSTGSR